ncbi:MAG: hypothetical protein V4532_13205 [Pseudomonadota bacterium]
MNRTTLKPIFWVLLALTLLTLAALGLIDEGIKTTASPWGIVSFELCAYRHACAEILQNWDPLGKQLAILSLGVDYLFMTLYPATIFVGLLLVSSRVPAGLRTVTVCLAWGAWLAGIADAFENYFLAQMVLTDSVHGLAWPAAMAATLKFAVFGVTVAWLIAACAWVVLIKPAK